MVVHTYGDTKCLKSIKTRGTENLVDHCILWYSCSFLSPEGIAGATIDVTCADDHEHLELVFVELSMLRAAAFPEVLDDYSEVDRKSHLVNMQVDKHDLVIVDGYLTQKMS